MTALDVRSVAGALGASVTGIDLAAVTESEQLEGLRRALADHLVVFLPDQHLDLDGLERIPTSWAEGTSPPSWLP